ncbi:MAG: transposase [Anaerolineales bacterium]|nr:transposase [Chloroflexota bacterium]MBL6982967.1 transposase [Anaerolineales bacterium]
MNRNRPPFLKDHFYHIYNRGARQLSIFREEENYLFVIRKMRKYCREMHLTPIAYCLMPNHYHFLIRQDGEKSAGLLPQYLFNSYSKAYNKRYGTSGTLFEGHYHSKQVDNHSYLLHLCRYIHTNPVKDGFVGDPNDWPYSNYLEWIGKRQGTLVDRQFVNEFFLTKESYMAFVSEFIEAQKLPDDLKSYLSELEG